MAPEAAARERAAPDESNESKAKEPDKTAPPEAAGDAQPAVESGAKALSDSHASSWYDAEHDTLRPVHLWREREPWKLPKINFSLEWLLWVFLAVLVAIVVAVLIHLLREYRGPGKRPKRTAAAGAVAVEQIEALPFMAERSHDDLLGQARRHYLAGNYREAIIYLFSYELVELDKSALVHLARGKTNRQYLREANRQPSLGNLLEATIVAFEDVFFGQRELDRARFESCWNRLDEFENLIARAVP